MPVGLTAEKNTKKLVSALTARPAAGPVGMGASTVSNPSLGAPTRHGVTTGTGSGAGHSILAKNSTSRPVDNKGSVIGTVAVGPGSVKVTVSLSTEHSTGMAGSASTPPTSVVAHVATTPAGPSSTKCLVGRAHDFVILYASCKITSKKFAPRGTRTVPHTNTIRGSVSTS